MSLPASTLALLVLAAPPEWLGRPPAAAPQRIVSLAPSHTEILFALGAGSRVVGVTRFDDEPPEVRSLPKVGGFVDPDPEAVLALAPALVVAVPIPGARQRLETLAALGKPVLVLEAQTLDDLWADIDVLARVVGARENGRALAARLHRELDAVRARTATARRLRVLFVVGYRPLIAAGPGSFLDGLLAFVNAENVVGRGAPFTHLDLEAAAAGRPDVVVDLTVAEHAPAGFWKRLDALGPSPALLVHLEDPALLRPGPRLGEALARLAAALRPAR